MVERVFLHIGQPKTGTTYLQQILWANRERLAAEGVFLPGAGHREHLWAALDVQERKNLARRDPRAPGTWGRLRAELEGIPTGAGLITHEFFCGATEEQARRVVADLAPARVDLIVTARDAAGMLRAGWQEMVKNGSRKSPREAAADDRSSEFSWQTWDLHGVLSRWSPTVPAERVHVLPVPGRQAPPDQHWHNFAGVLGLRGDYPIEDRPVNPSLGATQVELLRRVNAHLGDFSSAFDRGQYIRGYLAEGHLAHQDGERFALDQDLLEDCRTRSRRAVDLITEHGLHVVGDISTLLVDDAAPRGRDLATVTDDELLESAGRLIADMLADVRRTRSEQAAREPQQSRNLARRIRDKLRSAGRASG